MYFDEALIQQIFPGDNREKIMRVLEAIIVSSYDGIWVCDGKGTVISLNKASEKLLDLSASQVLGKTTLQLLNEGLLDVAVTPEVIEKKKVVTRIQRIQRTGKRLLVTGTPVFDEDGKVILVVTNERDMTTLDKITHELEKSRSNERRLKNELELLNKIGKMDSNFICESNEMTEAVKTAFTLASFDETNILLLGESGTGKGMLARLIHDNSARKNQDFIHINCAALPENLLEAELFGYEKGAFTGAREQGKVGLIELANQGTLFLDEIGELPLRIQSKVLTYLDTNTIVRLGGTAQRSIDCSIIAATNRDLDEMVKRQEFRKDLYYRLNTFCIELPPLRKRPEDLFELVHYYLERYNKKYKASRKIGSYALECLFAYHFPGNIRELRNLLKRAVALSQGTYIDDMVLDFIRAEQRSGEAAQPEPPSSEPVNLSQLVGTFEKVAIKKAMKGCPNTRELGERLGISQATVIRKMRKYGLKLAAK
jgi:PAS domain S-box-containing protein/TyrR family helix-turn-helix protein